MSLRTRTLRPASEELRAAVLWYESRRRGLGAEFLRAVNSTLVQIKAHPEAGSLAFDETDIRRLLVASFPYQVVYRYRPGNLIVVAFAHLKRRPDFWKNRQRS